MALLVVAYLASVELLLGDRSADTAFTGAAPGHGLVRRLLDGGRSSSVARKITMADIDALTVDDVPAGWRPRVSVSMSLKNAQVESIQRKLEDSYFIMAFNWGGMLTPEMEEARAMFPETVSVRVLKNTLVRKAMQGTPWEPFGKFLKGPNMYVFVERDIDLKDTVSAYIKLEKKFRRPDKVLQQYENNKEKVPLLFKPLVGGILRDEWKFIAPEDVPKLKDFPTKLELIARIAGGIKQVPTKIAKGTKQVTQKIAIGTKKIVEKMEEEGKSVVKDVVA